MGGYLYIIMIQIMIQTHRGFLELGRTKPRLCPTTNFVFDQALVVAAIPLYEQTRLDLVVGPTKTVMQPSPRGARLLPLRPLPHRHPSMIMSC